MKHKLGNKVSIVREVHFLCLLLPFGNTDYNTLQGSDNALVAGTRGRGKSKLVGGQGQSTIILGIYNIGLIHPIVAKFILLS